MVIVNCSINLNQMKNVLAKNFLEYNPFNFTLKFLIFRSDFTLCILFDLHSPTQSVTVCLWFYQSFLVSITSFLWLVCPCLITLPSNFPALLLHLGVLLRHAQQLLVRRLGVRLRSTVLHLQQGWNMNSLKYYTRGRNLRKYSRDNLRL